MKRFGGQLAACAALSFLSGCNCGLAIDPSNFRCDPGNVCPSGYECLDGFCHSLGGSGGGTSGTGGGKGGGAGGGSGGGFATGGGTSMLCEGVVCDMPPAPTCNGSTLRTFAGACDPQTGGCSYAPKDTACPNGCMNGQCVGDPCAGMTCTTPPAPRCDGNNVITSSLPGQCSNGACKYQESSTSCPSGLCAAGACVTPSLTFNQTLPRVRHAVTAVDQRPGASTAEDVVVVGPAGKASRWNGTQWSALTTGMSGNLTSIWFATPSTAYITAESGLLRLTGGTVTRVLSLVVPAGASLADVHGVSEGNLAVVDAAGALYRLLPTSVVWTTSLPGTGMRDATAFKLRGVYLEPTSTAPAFARTHAWGACTSAGTAGGCVVYQTSGGVTYDDVDTTVAQFTAGGPSLDSTGETWFGLDTPRLRRHLLGGTFDSTHTPSGLDGGAVVAIRPALDPDGGFVPGRGAYVLTAPDVALGHLYKVSGAATNPTVEPLLETLYGYQAMSKNESQGVIVVDMNTVTSSSTITRANGALTEALDLGAEDWVAGDSASSGSWVLMNGFGDVAVKSSAADLTFDVRRIPYGVTAVDVAASPNFAVLVGSDGTAWRVPTSSSGPFTQLTFSPNPTSLSGVCEASSTEWYLVGRSGAIYAYDGSMTRSMTSGTSVGLTDVHCPSAGVAVACGSGVVLRLSGGSWSALPAPPAGAIESCRMLGAQVYVAGPNLFARFSNGAWQTLAARPQLKGLVVRAANEAYAGDGTSVVRFDGAAWAPIGTSPWPLMTGFSMGTTRVVMAGTGGVLMEGQ